MQLCASKTARTRDTPPRCFKNGFTGYFDKPGFPADRDLWPGFRKNRHNPFVRRGQPHVRKFGP